MLQIPLMKVEKLIFVVKMQKPVISSTQVISFLPWYRSTCGQDQIFSYKTNFESVQAVWLVFIGGPKICAVKLEMVTNFKACISTWSS